MEVPMRWWFPLLCAGCWVSESRLDDAWALFVDDHNGCDVAEDCALVFPGCPLGCFEAVSVAHRDEAQAYADRLVRRYERGGRACDYDCMAPAPPRCDAGRCRVDPMAP
jgi:hypothetical protein